MELVALIVLVLVVSALALELFAFVDAVIRRPEFYVAASKQTKALWLVILGVALIFNPVIPVARLPLIGGIITFAGIIGAIVYVVDVRPALRELGGGRRPPSSKW